MTRSDELQGAVALIRPERWAALATADGNVPHVSAVACAAEKDFPGFLLHLSRLAGYTARLFADPRACTFAPDALRRAQSR